MLLFPKLLKFYGVNSFIMSICWHISICFPLVGSNNLKFPIKKYWLADRIAKKMQLFVVSFHQQRYKLKIEDVVMSKWSLEANEETIFKRDKANSKPKLPCTDKM